MSNKINSIAVVGGTGPQGRGLAYRFALAGYEVRLGSRSSQRAVDVAAEINAKVGDGLATGHTNGEAIRAADLVLLAIPWDGHSEVVQSLGASLAGKTIISCVNPLGFDKQGPYGLVLEDSAAQEVQRLVPTGRVVGAFHHVAAMSLWSSPELLSHDDIMVCGDDDEAKQIVSELAAAVTGKVGIDVGGLRLARQLEPLTAVLISVNKRYRTRSGLAVTGVGA